MKKFFHSISMYLLGISALYFSGCGDDNGEVEDLTITNEVTLSTNATLGDILVDDEGQSLYFFANDTKGTSTCLDGCLDRWPAFVTDELTVGSGLNNADFGTITREDDGTTQVTYKGWPLYYYAPASDKVLEEAGQTQGEAFGNVWFVAKPDYSIMIANAQLVGADGVSYTSGYVEGEGNSMYFVDENGRTLYTFINDANGYNGFTAPDLSNDGVWPIFFDVLEAIPSNLSNSDFEVIEVFGRQQLTYKGWPLYYFGQDSERGDNKGVSFPVPGVWPVPNSSIDEAPEYDGPTVKLTSNEDFETVITDYKGQSLYFFSNDANGENKCSGGCAEVWPVFYAEVSISENSELDLSDFSEITLTGGSKQTTYKGWPLYYYSPGGVLEDAGQTSGDGVSEVWYVAKHNYALMVANAQLVGHDGKNYTGSYEEGDGNTKYFTDSYGRTLYSFINDSKDTNNFTASDFSNNGVWPIFSTELTALPSVINASDLGGIDVFGSFQMTFKGWPLYYFGQDSERGENKGISFPAPGIWPIVNNDVTAAQE